MSDRTRNQQSGPSDFDVLPGRTREKCELGNHRCDDEIKDTGTDKRP